MEHSCKYLEISDPVKPSDVLPRIFAIDSKALGLNLFIAANFTFLHRALTNYSAALPHYGFLERRDDNPTHVNNILRSTGVKSRHCPGARSPGKVRGPSATRINLTVECPTAAVIRLIWRFSPSYRTRRSQVVFAGEGSGPGKGGKRGATLNTSTSAGRVRPNLISTPSRKVCRDSLEGCPSTRTR